MAVFFFKELALIDHIHEGKMERLKKNNET